MMGQLTDEEKAKMNASSMSINPAEKPSSVDLQSIKDENPGLYSKLMKYCKENGIDISAGKVDKKLLK
jgi:hypothetical protein